MKSFNMKTKLFTSFAVASLLTVSFEPTVTQAATTNTGVPSSQTTDDAWGNADNWTPDQISKFLNSVNRSTQK